MTAVKFSLFAVLAFVTCTYATENDLVALHDKSRVYPVTFYAPNLNNIPDELNELQTNLNLKRIFFFTCDQDTVPKGWELVNEPTYSSTVWDAHHLIKKNYLSSQDIDTTLLVYLHKVYLAINEDENGSYLLTYSHTYESKASKETIEKELCIRKKIDLTKGLQ